MKRTNRFLRSCVCVLLCLVFSVSLLPAGADAAAAPGWSLPTLDGGTVGSGTYANRLQLLVLYRATLIDGEAMCYNSAASIAGLAESSLLSRGDVKIIAADIDDNDADTVSAFKALYAPNCSQIVFALNGSSLLWSIVSSVGGSGSIYLAYCAIVIDGEVVDTWEGNYSAEMCEEHVEAALAARVKNGWVNQNGKWYYYQNNVPKTGWLKSGGKWYYLGTEGVMCVGWKQISGKWYYFNASGAMQTGWQKISNKWYYFNSSGAMVTGWQTISNKKYFFENTGAMATGWKQISGKWYYFDSSGARYGTAGWKQIDGKWYWFDSDGAARTGWLKLSGKWYWFNASAQMATGWKQISGKWYYFNNSGVMQTGWQKISGKWYWFESGGAMIASTDKTINGKTYHFDKNGVCTNP